MTPSKERKMYYNRNFSSFLNYDTDLTTLINCGSNSVIYNIFTCDVNFPVWRHYLEFQCDVINVKSFHGILRYLFQILVAPLTIISIKINISISIKIRINSRAKKGKGCHDEHMQTKLSKFIEKNWINSS